jgi:NAD-dependent SIR2 family protein deacetylase
MGRKKIALILGSGFSKEASLPTTAEIPAKFLSVPKNAILPKNIEERISEILLSFWGQTFNYEDSGNLPSLENHFTLIDLAANSGHHLGSYSPKMLRAIRRMSIHRVFSILAENDRLNSQLQFMFKEIRKNFDDVSIITLNWDLVAETHLRMLGLDFCYPIETYRFLQNGGAEPWPRNGIPIMKMHGSINWIYCDCCRRIYAGKTNLLTLHRASFLEREDFNLFFKPAAIAKMFREISAKTEKRKCPNCEAQTAGRVATFSYRKAFSIAQFQSVWEKAYSQLNKADIWLIVGYSLPEADFEFLHLLKSAQLARNFLSFPELEVVAKGDSKTVARYKSFFGLSDEAIKLGGLNHWVQNHLSDFIKNNR